MDFKQIADKIRYPEGVSDRFKRLDALERLRNGTFYDHLQTPFTKEDDGVKYIKMHERRPNVKFNAAKIITSQTSGLLWGPEQAPSVRCGKQNDRQDEDVTAEQAIEEMIERYELIRVMKRAYRRGVAGSAAIVIRAMASGKPHFTIVPGKNCKFTYDEMEPDRLILFTNIYSVTGDKLKQLGYAVDETKFYWMRIDHDVRFEIRYKPMVEDDFAEIGKKRQNGTIIEWEIDRSKIYEHGWLDRVPVVQLMNLDEPQGEEDDQDGPCLWGDSADNIVSLDYDLSQIQRGHRYSADPMLMVRHGELWSATSQMPSMDFKAKTDGNGNIIKSANNVLEVGQNGDAKMLETTGKALDAAFAFCQGLREYILEIAGAMKSNADNTKGAQSGAALKMLYFTLILVVTSQRVAYGDAGLLPLITLLLLGHERGLFEEIANLPASDYKTSLKWPQWKTPEGADLQYYATAMQSLAGGSAMAPVPIIPREDVTIMVANDLGFSDPNAMIQKLGDQVEQDAADAQALAEQQAQLEAKHAKPSGATA